MTMNATENEKLTVGMIVAVTCIDMSYYADTVSESYPFDLSRMTIYGQIMRCTNDAIAVAHQVHDDDGQVRHVSVIPRTAILSVARLKIEL